MPAFRDIRTPGGEVVVTLKNLCAGAVGTATARTTLVNALLPFVAAPSAPPHYLVRARGDVFRPQAAILDRMQFFGYAPLEHLLRKMLAHMRPSPPAWFYILMQW
jgi:hypothetical protein